MTTSYIVDINRADTRFRKLSLVLLGVAILGFWGLGFIEPIIMVITSDLFPKSILYGIVSILLIGIFSLLLLALKRNKDGLLKMHDDSVEIESKEKLIKVYFKDLKKISFVVATFTLKPYRIEFIYPDRQLTRVRLKAKEDF